MVAAVLIYAMTAVVQAVFVHAFGITAWLTFMNVSVQVEIVIWAEDAGECTVNKRMIPYILEFWNCWEQIVTWIFATGFFEGFINSFINFFVKLFWKVRV
jgi:hypothetical protein